MARLSLLARGVVAVARVALAVAVESPSFEGYLASWGLNYTGPERLMRNDLFRKALEDIGAQNSAPGALWEAELNEFAILTADERRLTLGGYRRPDEEGDAPVLEEGEALWPSSRDLLRVPGHLDWRDRFPSVATPVKRQGGCASCWAFAAAAALESAVALATGVLLDLSPQHIASCTPNKHKCGGDGGCGGGVAWLGFRHVKQQGAASAWSYPYVDHDADDDVSSTAKCLPLRGFRKPVAGIRGYVRLPHNREEALLRAVMRTPVAVTVDSDFHRYRRGIFNSCPRDAHIDHIVVLMGFGKSGDHHYWLARNSWGVQWGEAGYIRLLRRPGEEHCGYTDEPWMGYSCKDNLPRKVKVCGMCGILSDSSYPIGGHLLG